MMEASSQSEERAASLADASHDARNVGSYPPKPECMLLFSNLKALCGCGLEVLEENPDGTAQPEKDMEDLGKAKSIRRTTFSFPLDLFYNPELELHHPTLDIEEAHQRQERGVPGRSRFYSAKGDCSWEPCVVLSYNEETKDFLIEWIKNGKQKIVKRLNLILDREKESSFIAKVVDAKNLRKMVEAEMVQIPTLLAV